MAAVGGWTGGIKARVREATEEAASVFRQEMMMVLRGPGVERRQQVRTARGGVHRTWSSLALRGQSAQDVDKSLFSVWKEGCTIHL